MENGFDFRQKKSKLQSKLVVDLYAFWRIMKYSTNEDNNGTEVKKNMEFGWQLGKKFCLCCDQICNRDLLRSGAGVFYYFVNASFFFLFLIYYYLLIFHFLIYRLENLFLIYLFSIFIYLFVMLVHFGMCRANS
jgi:hypothetical protein